MHSRSPSRRNSSCGGDSPRSMPSTTSSIWLLSPSTHARRIPRATNGVHRRHDQGVHLRSAQGISGGIGSVYAVSTRTESPWVSNSVIPFLSLTSGGVSEHQGTGKTLEYWGKFGTNRGFHFQIA